MATEMSFEARALRLKEAGSALYTQAAISREIRKKYNRNIDPSPMSRAFRGELPTQGGGEIRKMIEDIIAAEEKRLGVTA